MSKLVCPDCRCEVKEDNRYDEPFWKCPKCKKEYDEFGVEEID